LSQKIVSCAELINLPSTTIQNHYDTLLQLGFTPKKINTNAKLLGMNPDTITKKYRYLTITLQVEEKLVQNLPKLLSDNSDSFAKKMRMLKLEILKIKWCSEFNPNDYRKFFIVSPATLMAKKKYCIDNNISYKNKLWILMESWKNLSKRANKSISDAEANSEGKRITRPYKRRYDEWMGEYKKWAKNFALRRGRRLITRL